MKEHRHCTEQCYQNARQDEEKEIVIGALCIRYKPTEKTDVHRNDNTLP